MIERGGLGGVQRALEQLDPHRAGDIGLHAAFWSIHRLAVGLSQRPSAITAAYAAARSRLARRTSAGSTADSSAACAACSTSAAGASVHEPADSIRPTP